MRASPLRGQSLSFRSLAREEGETPMRYSVLGTNYVIRLDTGEKIVATLLSLCERDGIGSGFFSGLGAVGEAELGHFDPATGDYS